MQLVFIQFFAKRSKEVNRGTLWIWIVYVGYIWCYLVTYYVWFWQVTAHGSDSRLFSVWSWIDSCGSFQHLQKFALLIRLIKFGSSSSSCFLLRDQIRHDQRNSREDLHVTLWSCYICSLCAVDNFSQICFFLKYNHATLRMYKCWESGLT